MLIRGSDRDDTLTVDFSGGNSIRSGRLTFDGGNGNDALSLIGGSVTDDTHRFKGSNGYLTKLDDRTIQYRDVEAIADHLTVTNRDFQFGSGNDVVTLSDNAASSDGINRMVLVGGPILDFTNPNGTFTIHAGAGDDTVTLFGADALLACPVQVFGNDCNDVLSGLMADDSLDGGAGNDTLAGNDGDDVIVGLESELDEEFAT